MWKSGFTDSGRESININEGAPQKSVIKNTSTVEPNTQTFGVGQTQLGSNSATNRSQPPSNEQYAIEKENLRLKGNSELIYDHRPEEHFEITKQSASKHHVEQPDTRVPSKLANKLRTLSCQLDFITKYSIPLIQDCAGAGRSSC